MAFCSHCGSRLTSGDPSCRTCGTRRATAGWALATDVCSCTEPIGPGWRFCVSCGQVTAVSTRGRSVKVDPARVQSWLADLRQGDHEPAPRDETVAVEIVEERPVELISRPPASGPELPPSAAAPPAPRPDVPTLPAARLESYRSAALAAVTVQRTVFATAILTLAAAATLWVLNSRLRAFDAAEADVFDGALAVGRVADFGTRPLVILGGLVTVRYLVRWTTVVYSNITALGRSAMRLPVRAVRWSFLIPGVNLVIPPRLVNDSWRAADGSGFGGRDWMLQPGNLWTNLTWSAMVAAIVLHALGWRSGSATVDAAIDANRWGMWGYVALTVALISSAVMVQQITGRQDRRAAELDELLAVRAGA